MSIELPLAGDKLHEVFVKLDLDNKTVLEFCDRHLIATCNLFQTAWAIAVSWYAGVERVSFMYGMNVGQCSGPEHERLYLFRAQVDPKSRLLDTLLAAESCVNYVSDQSGLVSAECLNEPFDEAASAFSSSLYVTHQLEHQVSHAKQDEKCLVLVQFIIENDNTISMSIHAHASEFPITQVESMVHTLQKTLTEIISAQSEYLIEDLDICSQHDLVKIMDWNQQIPDHVESCFHWHFEKVASRTPDATAICSWDRDFTYKELDITSTKVANHLRYLGVVPGSFIGICFDKSSTTYVCMLSILKAGGAFVAIDPLYPISRIRAIMEATKASIVMAAPMHCHLFNEFAEQTVAINSKIIDELPPRPSLAGPRPSPSDIAYAVFTSGSTGTPKGILIEHRSLCIAALALASALRIDSSSRVLQFAAYTFDVSYGDTFVTLAQGGCICVPSEQERFDNITGAMVRMNVNNACLIPSVARMFRPENVPCLKNLLLGGEALIRDNLDTWAEKVTLSVVYGPSECTVWCASQVGVEVDSPPNTIGRGVGALLWIASATNHDRLCPIGCIGELLIEGPGLARGYLDAEQTSHAFIENPSWAHIETGHRRRFYKTGDLVRYQPDGTLLFMGRKDTQIKLHGRRIELGEVEYHLSCHDLLKQSMVLFPKMGTYRHKLVAILVFKTSVVSDDSPSELKPLIGNAMQKYAGDLTDVKAFLSSRIPSYMLPQEWIAVEKVPLMTSGKMNRVLTKRFVENLMISVREDTSNIFPQNHIIGGLGEPHLRQIWSQVLDIDINKIGPETGFVGLGGDSFTAMDLVARCKAEGFSFTVAELLNDGTVRQMAAKAKFASSNAAGSALENGSQLRSQCKSAPAKPLVLFPVWWRSGCSLSQSSSFRKGVSCEI